MLGLTLHIGERADINATISS